MIDYRYRMYLAYLHDRPTEVNTWGWIRTLICTALILFIMAGQFAKKNAENEYRNDNEGTITIKWNLGPYEYAWYQKRDDNESVQRFFFFIPRERITVETFPNAKIEFIDICRKKFLVFPERCTLLDFRLLEPFDTNQVIQPDDYLRKNHPLPFLIRVSRKLSERIVL